MSDIAFDWMRELATARIPVEKMLRMMWNSAVEEESRPLYSVKKVVIVGGGPAGLTAALELSRHGVPAVVLEADKQVGGLARTVNYKGYLFDIGGHRFFTKWDEVNQIWNEVLGPRFLERPRLSRIYYKKRFFLYPLVAKNASFGLGLRECQNPRHA